ncbi:adhesion G-protein coupled receptor D1-like [Amphiura filiformis]|uniref:adhesion G-protein coupled receptor D1-like n=1 Tax=Amphiura filiformis TaxID=82378 RepID=UPI003B21EEAE
MSNNSNQAKYINHFCGYWDVRNNRWSREGSFTYEDDMNETYQTCGFNHLTSFAVLFEFSKDDTQVYSHVIEEVVATGIVISIISLIFGLVVCVILWNKTSLDKEKILVHANLMLAMAVAYIVTFGSKWASSNQIACHTVTILRYNMLMTVFCCMLVEALHLYRMIVLVFGIERNFRVVYIVIGWGAPMLMTTITAAIGREHLYDPERYSLQNAVLIFYG